MVGLNFNRTAPYLIGTSMVSCRSSNQSIRLPAKLPRHSWNGRRLREARPTLEKDDRKGLQRGARELFWHFVGDVPGSL